ncbi:addiction module toxin, Txe/YoeB family [Solidesulfovibrio carbinoliphilus subsp. oakridgensis]|uniref:Putative mRNA interferase YoeB n=1 Tax=Solidesulfovibrio carbinoliphilus subsp. oakridgensis TaxID=694327 RepID=G7Q8B3_9BACT|nr:Txe/YoeB family addiction module toxin [Solidesulfovibrio carbinoliphilus]EHJ48525.1 addiction module toxin, Txe/YoeB family [Solidesulfovibrio carbinoliphilus subsp. oakridgensis]
MRLVWTAEAWEDYRSWQATDKGKVRKINALIREMLREPFAGTGKPEPLKFDLAGCWSRRIDQEHRLVYTVLDGDLILLACRYHY